MVKHRHILTRRDGERTRRPGWIARRLGSGKAQANSRKLAVENGGSRRSRKSERSVVSYSIVRTFRPLLTCIALTMGSHLRTPAELVLPRLLSLRNSLPCFIPTGMMNETSMMRLSSHLHQMLARMTCQIDTMVHRTSYLGFSPCT